MKTYAERKEIYLVMALLFSVVLACLFVSIIFAKDLSDLKNRIDEPIICVPTIKEDQLGDIYILHCVKESVFNEAAKENNTINNTI